MRTVLVLGSNGLIGQKIVNRLSSDEQYNVVAASKNKNINHNKLNYIFELLDVTNRAELSLLFEKYSPQFVINLVAKASPDWCEENKVECWDVNVNAVEQIVKLSNKYQAHLIHFSTDFIFDGIKGNYSEEDIPNPINYYGLSKLESENIVTSNCLKWTIIRTAIVYGFAEEVSRSNFVLTYKKRLEQGDEIKIAQDQFRTATFVDDLAKVTIEILKNNLEGIYHISGNENLSVYEMVQKLAEIFNLNPLLIVPVNTYELNEKAKRPLRTGFKIEKAYNELAFSPVNYIDALRIIQNQMTNQ